MKYQEKQKIKNIAVYCIIIILTILILNLFLFFMNNQNKKSESNTNHFAEQGFINFNNSTVITMEIPAVDSEGKGASTTLVVEATKGTGRTFTDIENSLFWADTQQSIRVARAVAENITEINPKEYDLIYKVNANASIVGGPSAGAAIAIATIFAIKGEQPKTDVIITGTINHDGTIGPVGGIIEKALASKEAGAKIFIVPLTQSKEVIYETSRYCQQFGTTELCTEETRPRTLDVKEESGIQIIEVSNIEEALKYF